MKARAATAAVLALCASAAGALAPLPPCQVTEAGMTINDVDWLGQGTGIVVDGYASSVKLVGNTYQPQPGPVPALDGFGGSRVTHCATGEFVAIPGATSTGEVVAALGATEFLRAKVKSAKPVSASQMKRAARAVFGQVIVLRETDETCACNTFFPELRPAGFTPFGARGDVTN